MIIILFLIILIFLINYFILDTFVVGAVLLVLHAYFTTG